MRRHAARSTRAPDQESDGAPASLERVHRFHSYCARFPSEIAEAAIDQFTGHEESVYDPFCGSGTSLVAALVRKRKALGCDIDVLAGLLSEIKCSPLPPSRYKSWRRDFVGRLTESFAEIDRCWSADSRPKPGEVLKVGSLVLRIPAFPQLNYWFPPQLIAFLSAVAHTAHGCLGDHYEKVALVSLSAAIIAKWPNTLSYAMDVDHTRPHRRLQRFSRAKVLATYLRRLDRTIECLGALYSVYKDAGVLGSLSADARVVCPQDARVPLPDLPASSQALVITSPPYFNAVDYPRAHRLSVCWMNGHAPQDVATRRNYVGLRHVPESEGEEWLREHEAVGKVIPSPLRGTSVGHRLAAFFADLDSVLEQTWRVLSPGGHAVFVIADNIVQGHPVRSHQALADLGSTKGFVELHRKPRSIASVRRRFPVGTFGFNGPMTREQVVVLRKPKRGTNVRDPGGST